MYYSTVQYIIWGHIILGIRGLLKKQTQHSTVKKNWRYKQSQGPSPRGDCIHLQYIAGHIGLCYVDATLQTEGIYAEILRILWDVMVLGKNRGIEVEEKEGKEEDREIEYYIANCAFFMWQHSSHTM